MVDFFIKGLALKINCFDFLGQKFQIVTIFDRLGTSSKKQASVVFVWQSMGTQIFILIFN
jgi:hypothetical protein